MTKLIEPHFYSNYILYVQLMTFPASTITSTETSPSLKLDRIIP